MKKAAAKHRAGQAMLTAILFFLTAMTLLVGAVVGPVVRETRASTDLVRSKQTYALAEGGLEDVLYRTIAGLPVSSLETYSSSSTSISVSSVDAFEERTVTATGDQLSRIRKVEARLFIGSGASFNFGVQADTGGIILENFSSILGNGYANGSVTGKNNNIIYGDVISAGPTGLIDGVHATGSAYAHTIKNSTIDRDAYYQSIQSSSVGGTSYPGSADQPTTTLPISDELVEDWKSDAEAGGTITSPCPYTVSSGSVTLGPKKINCDVTISGTATVNLAGPVWVSGNLTLKNSVVIRTDASVGNKSVAIIVDNPSNRISSSKITLENSITFEGTGTARSYILLLSQNNDAENGGSNKAIEIKNSANGDLLLYAGHGEVLLSNNVQLNEVTGYRIRLQNSAQVVYKSGLASLLFTSGPSGSFTIDRWSEVQ